MVRIRKDPSQCRSKYYSMHRDEVLDQQREYKSRRPQIISKAYRKHYYHSTWRVQHLGEWKARYIRERESRLQYQKEYASRNKEKIAAYRRLYRLSPELRAKQNATRRLTNRFILQIKRCKMRKAKVYPFTPEQWREIKTKYNFTCPMCRRHEPEIQLTVDHAIPISRGGFHIASNIQPLCRSCNSRKHAHVWFASALFLLPAPRRN